MPLSVTDPWDVVILGAGFAGLTLALQLRKQVPHWSLLVVDKAGEVIMDGTHKVGESVLEGAGFHLCSTLDLDAYVRENHLKKFGVRAFGGSTSDFARRLEIGGRNFNPLFPSYQLDRGILERDLRRKVVEAGAELRLECRVEDIDLAERVVRLRNGSVRFKWVVDALGRSRFLQRRLGLGLESPHRASACWWRVRGVHDVSDIVPKTNTAFHGRTVARRWFSTNHVMGDGYWMWFIPLASDHTSIGIVSTEDQHPIRERSSWEDARSFLEKHEPGVARLLRGTTPADFHALKEFSYRTQRAFGDRWACVGEAAAFTDPLWSHGSESMAWANSAVTALIARDAAGRHDPSIVDLYDRVFRNHIDDVMALYTSNYGVLGRDRPLLAKYAWDFAHYWSCWLPVLVHRAFDDPAIIAEYLPLARQQRALNERVQTRLREWIHDDPAPVGRYHLRTRMPAIAAIPHAVFTRESRSDFIARRREVFASTADLAEAIFREAGHPADPSEAMATQLKRYLDDPVLPDQPEWFEQDQFSG